MTSSVLLRAGARCSVLLRLTRPMRGRKLVVFWEGDQSDRRNRVGAAPVVSGRERVIAAGHQVGNYRVLAEIGQGGMGMVYLAEHPLIGKRVALKVIHRELARSRELISRFFLEAQAVGKIGSEHIVQILDFGQTPEGHHFMIMEHLEGQTLSSVLATRGRLSEQRMLHIAAQVAMALGAAHDAGIIHRDLKPDNVMLIPHGGDSDFVKILDFGLAKVLESTAALTAVGVALGTPQYMSPEACESRKDVDHRTDIYALGALMFQMSTGVVPFDGDSMGAVMVKQLTELPPSPRGLNPGISPAVEQIILKCLAKTADARFPTMHALCDALRNPDAYLHREPLPMPARSLPPGEGLTVAAVLAATASRNPSVSEAASQRVPIVAPQNQTMILDDPAGATARRRTRRVLLLWLLLVAVAAGVALALPTSTETKANTERPRPAEQPAATPR